MADAELEEKASLRDKLDFISTYSSSGSSRAVQDTVRENNRQEKDRLTFVKQSPKNEKKTDDSEKLLLPEPLKSPYTEVFHDFLDVAVPTVRDMVTCQFEKLPVPFFEDGFFLYGKGTSVFTNCNNGGIMITNVERARKCAKEMSKECSKSSAFVTKIIRMPLYSFEKLMEQIPRLKIIHLLRDPRPTMLSQLKAGNVKRLYLKTNVTSYCNRVYDDVVKAEDFNRKFPGRLMRVYYEDIVKRPLELTRKMYDFSGMPFTDKVSYSILKLTGENRNHKTSNDRASAWRSDVNMDFIKAVDTSCNQLYTKVGFQKMATEDDIRDISKHLRGAESPYDDFRFA
ncbi:carbohydrate sulfotransferase 1-like [Ylistrum balloti]|uniref:carbohydrate sulfotransferase 1-like n=1 Tax=Ylistrum balloti TaxID=509963 RepID=UPI002905D710|nr:carbohydrate sulfotransferase 1-like [Ylistrum balloti]